MGLCLQELQQQAGRSNSRPMGYRWLPIDFYVTGAVVTGSRHVIHETYSLSKVPWSATVVFITFYFSGQGSTCRGDVQQMQQEYIGQILLVGYVDVQWSRDIYCVILVINKGALLTAHPP